MIFVLFAEDTTGFKVATVVKLKPGMDTTGSLDSYETIGVVVSANGLFMNVWSAQPGGKPSTYLPSQLTVVTYPCPNFKLATLPNRIAVGDEVRLADRGLSSVPGILQNNETGIVQKVCHPILSDTAYAPR